MVASSLSPPQSTDKRLCEWGGWGAARRPPNRASPPPALAPLRTTPLPRASDAAASADGSIWAVLCCERRVRLFRHGAFCEEVGVDDAGDTLTSLALSRDGASLLTSAARGAISLWNIGGDASGRTSGEATPTPPALTPPGAPSSPHPAARVFTLRGRAERGGGKFIIRPCFGGAHQGFVASGSEDCCVYIWSRATARLLLLLEGHTGAVNTVSWHPTCHGVLASVSDDGDIRLWASGDTRREWADAAAAAAA